MNEFSLHIEPPSYYCINIKYVVEIKMKANAYCFYLYYILSCQPGVTVTSCFVCRVIRDLESICHLCIDPIHRIGLIHK